MLNLKAGDIFTEGNVYYSYRSKRGKQGKRELPRPAYDAIYITLAAFGKDLATMKLKESLWPSKCREAGRTDPAFYGNFRRYLAKAGLPPRKASSLVEQKQDA
ncbi:MAG: hypothetical protein ABIH46_10235, partial [Chloroflexota bacterium]